MKYPWANVLILLLGGAELVTGYLALTSGTPQWVAALHVHRILGFGIVVLLIWKGQNILLRLLNPRLWRRLLLPYMASVLLLALLLARPRAWAGLEPCRPFPLPRFQRRKLAYLPVAGPDPLSLVAYPLPSLERAAPFLGGTKDRPPAGRTWRWPGWSCGVSAN